MKANYLRARQLVDNGAFRGAVPYLEVSSYYAGRGTRFSHLSRYWIAESYFRDGQYAKARSIYVELYNMSALYNSPEAYLITYNLAYCYFMERDYTNALKWFDKYLDEAQVASIHSVTIIHGKGTGALRAAIWNNLKKDSRVSAFRAGVYGEGDYGVTVVELK
jgi:tetratricopeptide (TPR) repeat protein